MGALNQGEQREVAAFTAVQPRERVLEVGCGPGVLVGLMLDAGAIVTDWTRHRRCARWLSSATGTRSRTGRAEVRGGSAEDTGCPDASFDVAVSVNNVPMWSDLGAGMWELRRVVRPGGRVVVSWHGGTRPGVAARSMVLGDETLDRILGSMRAAFGTGERYDGRRIVAFRASVPPDAVAS